VVPYSSFQARPEPAALEADLSARGITPLFTEDFSGP
jgi:hypothetical protein